MIEETIRQLAQARAQLEVDKAYKKSLIELLEATEEYQIAQADLSLSADRVERLENTLRAEALGQYEADHNKTGHGYKIKTETAVTIPDTQKAVEWCKGNFTPALKLNESILKTAARNGTVPAEIATVTEQPKVYIDSDLSDYIKERTA